MYIYFMEIEFIKIFLTSKNLALWEVEQTDQKEDRVSETIMIPFRKQ